LARNLTAHNAGNARCVGEPSAQIRPGARDDAGARLLPDLRNALVWLQAEFESTRLEVILVPCRSEVNVGGCIRVAASQNAKWYRALCAAYPSGRFRRNLARLVNGQPSRSRYVADILRAAARVADSQRRKSA
jgi:hypothetical protein